MKDHILFFLAFTITYSILTILLSSLRGEISYEVDIVQTLVVGFFTTLLVGWINRREAKKRDDEDLERKS